jgi:pimeloyl-ACP methyl ester carboxylesterase
VSLTPRVIAWRDQGWTSELCGHGIHVFGRDGTDPVLLLLHGFPSSSYDWRLLLERESDPAVLAFDCLGFGLSEKPAGHDYTLGEQADIAEALWRLHGDGRSVFLVGHDMGTSVATELMARDIDGALEMEVRGALLFNGSMIRGQPAPRSPSACCAAPLAPSSPS